MATVFPFPLVKRGDLIRRHAESITSLSGEKQRDRIKQIVKSLYATMRARSETLARGGQTAPTRRGTRRNLAQSATGRNRLSYRRVAFLAGIATAEVRPSQ